MIRRPFLFGNRNQRSSICDELSAWQFSRGPGRAGTRYGARGMGNSIYVRDPEGNMIELKQMPGGGENSTKE